jgi:DNA topoisomerase-1
MGPKPFRKDSAKYLVIVESASKCLKIESYLGSQYKCIASNGHIRQLEGLKSIDTKRNYEPTFTIPKEKSKHVEQMRTILGMFSNVNVILATDDDREGEAIAWHICETFDLSIADTQRIKFNEITKTAILRAVENPIRIDMDLVHAQHARQVLDMLVGFKISPLLWKYLYNDKTNGLSAGRCQTPALRLVYDNEKARTAPDLSYRTRGKFTSKNIDFTLSKEFLIKDDAKAFLSKSVDFKHYLGLGSPTESVRGPPKPFNTSRLLQHVSHMSPKETMALCQTLYQEGHITYMRTDSTKYSKDFLAEAKTHITKEWGDKYVGQLDKIENVDASNPHEAIRVTKLEITEIECADPRLNTMYKTIWKNTLESCMSDAKYSVTECRISAPDDLFYRCMIEVPLFYGWKKHRETEDQNDGNGMIFYFKSMINSPVQYSYIESTVSFTNRHSHYTESSLISKLEDLGIGRPSTFASLVDVIQERGYVKKTNIDGEKHKCVEYKLSGRAIEEIKIERVHGNEKNKLVIQPTGVLIIEFLTKTFESLFSYDYTDKMEKKLDEISRGNGTIQWYDVCKECHALIRALTNSVSKETYKLDDKHDFVFTKNGPAISNKLADGTIGYKSVRKDIAIDLDKLRNGGYNIDELVEIPIQCIGKIGEHDVFIKHGKFGAYAEWGENKKSIDTIIQTKGVVTIGDIIDNPKSSSSCVLRTLTNDLSIRKGKYGAYAHYQRKDMPKPEFYNIKKFREGFSNCNTDVLINWLCKTYNMPKMSEHTIE